MRDLARAVTETIPRLVFEAAERHGGKPAVVDVELGEEMSFAGLAEAARAAGRAFIAAGLEPGEAVAVWAANGWRWVAAAAGAQAAGGVIVPLNTRLTGRETADIIRRAKVRFLVAAGAFLGRDYAAMLNGHPMPQLRAVITLDDRGSSRQATVLGWSQFLAAGGDIEAAALDARLARLRPDDPADIMFTSGTTGLPKGAVFTHRKTLLAAQTFSAVSGLSAHDRYLPFGPFSHTASYKGGWLAALLVGATLYARNLADTAATLELVSRERISFMPAPPTVLQAMLADPARAEFDLSSLRFISTGGTMVPLALVRRLKAELGVAHVATGYGLTESAGTATFTRPDDPLEVVVRTAGRAAPGVAIRCVRADGSEAPVGEAGEVLIRTDKTMSGYLGDPEATAAVIGPDGWLRTGDVGWLDAAGNLTITDRLKDMYITGGFNCYPAEIERELGGYPGVLQCAVIGVPDARLGEVGRAFVVAAPGAALAEPEILAWCKERFANYKVPRSVRFVEALPTNASGKVLKQVLRAAG
jgi:acyl-CoA synthetase (AMP-forming)/AMP-acid ligase II